MTTMLYDSELREPILVFRKGISHPLTANFNSTEFDCRCRHKHCTYTFISAGLVIRLQSVRHKVGLPVSLHCGYRCPYHNGELEKVGASAVSQHMAGRAADIEIPGMSIRDTYRAVRDSFTGIGLYDTFVHVDTRPDINSFWDKRKGA